MTKKKQQVRRHIFASAALKRAKGKGKKSPSKRPAGSGEEVSIERA